jgi:type IV pilus assembly protein PilN
MIRINLLSVERERGKKKGGPMQVGQKLTLACSLILVLTGLFIGWRYWSISRDSQSVDDAIAGAQLETGRLHALIQQVQEFEQRRAQLQQRVSLIEELRRGQSGPVHMLDQISRSLPPMLWLTELKQPSPLGRATDASPNEVVVDGRCLSLTSLSDFVANLEASGYFKRSVEIVSSGTEAMSVPPGELIKFSIKATFQPPAPPPVQKSAAAPRKGG